MKIVLATGIYPPDIGGPAIYVKNLASELSKKGHNVTVITYNRKFNIQNQNSNSYEVIHVRFGVCHVLRWLRYARALKKIGESADIVYAFSSVSCGIPLKLARLKRPKKLLRLGGDFFWERYTAIGGKHTLVDFYSKCLPFSCLSFFIMNRLLNAFDHLVFSTSFQEKIYEKHFKKLPSHSVIENALPRGMSEIHVEHKPFFVLFMGRFVGFKNLTVLLKAIRELSDVRLTIVGDGPKKQKLNSMISSLKIRDRVMFASPVHGEEKRKVFAGHDLLIIPSITEISPNVALEARACGLPVLLTKETGLSERLKNGMVIRDLLSVDSIVKSIKEIQKNYQNISLSASDIVEKREWDEVAEESLKLFKEILVNA